MSPAGPAGQSRRSRLPYWIAFAAVAALGLWMASGLLSHAPPQEAAAPEARSPEPMAVQVEQSWARPIDRVIVAQAEAQPDRSVPLRAAVAGRVEVLPVEKGQRIAQGALILRLAPGDRTARLARAEAERAQREREYEAAQRLAARDFGTEARRREAFALLQAARAAVKQIQEEIDDTTIEAPFTGIVNGTAVELGEYVPVGTEVARILDLDPLVVALQAPQQEVQRISLGAEAEVQFATGETRKGQVRFISADADRATRTFLVEVHVPNADGGIPSGVSAEVRLPTGTVDAHLVSPAYLALNAAGELGVKSVDAESIVRFHPVKIVRGERDGVWLAGLPQQLRLITRGQGFVSAGERVRAVAGQAAERRPDDEAGRGDPGAR